ncbi:hypothetical protein LOD99_10277 [Oopsacas minuta]|uniref:Uncharacterized protein n=1 Tax=Oopsacas minuta TaxID=111878 RepID=A0AAV7KHF5_9METZ|nr:hypothetical protein LOD99_10277 [Oopsacas minuta]
MGCSSSKHLTTESRDESKKDGCATPLTMDIQNNHKTKEPKRPNDLLFIKMALKRYLGIEYSIYVANPNRILGEGGKNKSYGVGDGDQIILTFLNTPLSEPLLVFPDGELNKLLLGSKMPESNTLFICRNTNTHTNLYIFRVMSCTTERLMMPYLPDTFIDNCVVPLLISDDISYIIKDPDRFSAVKKLESDVLPTILSHPTCKGHVASRYEWYHEGEVDNFVISKVSNDAKNCFWTFCDDIVQLTSNEAEAIRGKINFI